jgi:hypothetical protein
MHRFEYTGTARTRSTTGVCDGKCQKTLPFAATATLQTEVWISSLGSLDGHA